MAQNSSCTLVDIENRSLCQIKWYRVFVQCITSRVPGKRGHKMWKTHFCSPFIGRSQFLLLATSYGYLLSLSFVCISLTPVPVPSPSACLFCEAFSVCKDQNNNSTLIIDIIAISSHTFAIVWLQQYRVLPQKFPVCQVIYMPCV